MSKQLVIAIREALDSQSVVAIRAELKHQNRSRDAFEILVRHELIAHVREALQREPEFSDDPNIMINSGGGGSSLLMSAPGVLLQWSKTIGSIKAVQRFKKIISKTEAPGYFVVALSAPTIDKAQKLSKDTTILPFAQLPVTPQSERLRLRQFNYEFGLHEPPSAALLFRRNVSPLFYSTDERANSIFKTSKLPFDEMNDIRLSLALIGPCTPIRLSGWFQFRDPALNELSSAGNISYPGGTETATFKPVKPAQFDVKIARNLIKQLKELKGHDRDRVRRSMERLLQAMCRRLPGDAAIDLSIALEALTGDTGAPGEHLWKVGLRTALLDAGNMEVRSNTRNLVKRIYEIRSQVMHDGVISKRHQRDAATIIRDGIDRSSTIISNVIKRRGLPPNWSKFELSGGKYY